MNINAFMVLWEDVKEMGSMDGLSLYCEIIIKKIKRIISEGVLH
jgi:hypothetical protein